MVKQNVTKKGKNTKNATKEKANNEPKNFAIIGIIIAVMIVAIITGVLLIVGQKKQDPETVDVATASWEEQSLDILDKVVSEEGYEGLEVAKMKNPQAYFIDVEDSKDSIMALEYRPEDGAKEVVLFVQDSEGKARKLDLSEMGISPLGIDYYYNILEDQSGFYVSYLNPNSNDAHMCYARLEYFLDFTELGKQPRVAYCDTLSENPNTLDDKNGNGTSTYIRLDKAFLEVDAEDENSHVNNSIKLSQGMTRDELKQAYDKSMAKMRELKTIIATRANEYREQKAETKQKEEQAKQETAASQTNDGIMLGNELIKYGTYQAVSDFVPAEELQGAQMIIRKDGTLTLISKNGRENYTYKIGKRGFAQDPAAGQDIHDAIILVNASGQETNQAYFCYNGFLSSGDIVAYQYLNSAE